MRKVLPITISFLLLTFSMTQSAIAQKRNVITNQTTEALYVVYSTKAASTKADSLGDPFENGKLQNPNWKWRNEPLDWDVGETRKNHLYIDGEPNRNLWVDDQTHFLYQEIDTDNFDVETHFSAKWNTSSGVNGIMVKSPKDNNWVTIKFWSRDAGSKGLIQYQTRQAGMGPGPHDIQWRFGNWGDIELSLRLKKQGNTYTAWYKAAQDTNWVDIGQGNFKLTPPLQLGIYAGVAANTGKLEVEYEYFKDNLNPAEAPIPAGYRTHGWKKIPAGQQKTFWAYDPYKIYFQIWKGSDRIKPQRATQTFAFWINRNANFDIVTRQAINASITRGQLVYSSHDTSLLTHSDGFMRYNNGSRITVTDAWVDVADDMDMEADDTTDGYVDPSALAQKVYNKHKRTFEREDVQEVVPDVLIELKSPDIQLLMTQDAILLIANDPDIVKDILPDVDDRFINLLKNDAQIKKLIHDTDFQKLLQQPAAIDALFALITDDGYVDPSALAQKVYNKHKRTFEREDVQEVVPDVLIELKSPDIQLLMTQDAILLIANDPDIVKDILPDVDDRFINLLKNDAQIKKLIHDTDFQKLLQQPAAIDALFALITDGDSPINIPDPNLRAAIEDALGRTIRGPGVPITIADMETLTNLNASDKDISSIIGLEFAINLISLDLSDNGIVDISRLSGLTNLTELGLSYNQILDLTPLKGLKKLTSLSLDSNGISDVAPLAHLKQLTKLNLGNNRISHLSPLTQLKQLTWLYLSYNQIADVSPLAQLTNLIALYLSNNQIADFSAIAGLVKDLESYDNTNQTPGGLNAPVNIPDPNLRAAIKKALGKTQGSAITIAEMQTLTTLKANHMGIQDVIGLEFATNLTWLGLWNNQISDISPLTQLKNLTALYLSGNEISDVAALAGLKKLETLWIWVNRISDISALAQLTNLTSLSLSHNNISDVAALAGLKKLETLWIDGNLLSDIAALAQLTNLKELSLPDNQISDISALIRLKNLTRLHLVNNQISDISAIAALTNLKKLYLSNNRISDFSPIAGLIPNLEEYISSPQLKSLIPHAVEISGPTTVTSVIRDYTFTATVKNASNQGLRNVEVTINGGQTVRTNSSGQAKFNLSFPSVGTHDMTVRVRDEETGTDFQRHFPDRVKVPKPYSIELLKDIRVIAVGRLYTALFVVKSAAGETLEGFEVRMNVGQWAFEMIQTGVQMYIPREAINWETYWTEDAEYFMYYDPNDLGVVEFYRVVAENTNDLETLNNLNAGVKEVDFFGWRVSSGASDKLNTALTNNEGIARCHQRLLSNGFYGVSATVLLNGQELLTRSFSDSEQSNRIFINPAWSLDDAALRNISAPFYVGAFIFPTWFRIEKEDDRRFHKRGGQYVFDWPDSDPEFPAAPVEPPSYRVEVVTPKGACHPHTPTPEVYALAEQFNFANIQDAPVFRLHSEDMSEESEPTLDETPPNTTTSWNRTWRWTPETTLTMDIGVTVLTVRFLDGTEDQIRGVKDAFEEWESVGAMVFFNFVDTGPADIRITFDTEKILDKDLKKRIAEEGAIGNAIQGSSGVFIKLLREIREKKRTGFWDSLGAGLFDWAGYETEVSETQAEKWAEFEKEQDKRTVWVSAKLAPIDFYNCAQHEIGHILGFEHMDDVLEKKLNLGETAHVDEHSIMTREVTVGLGEKKSLSGGDKKALKNGYTPRPSEGWKPYHVTGRISIQGKDDEWSGFHEYFDDTSPYVDIYVHRDHDTYEFFPFQHFKWGGEIRVEVDIGAKADDNDGSVMMAAKVRLYEGDDVDTSQLEDEKTEYFSPGQAHTIRVENHGQGDYAEVTFDFRYPAPQVTAVGLAPSSVSAPDDSASVDVNGDGQVDAADLVLVSNHIGQSAPETPPVDVNGDGSVTIADLVQVAQYLGQSMSASAPVSVVVPNGLTYETVEAWIHQARLEDDGSRVFHQGIAKLEYLLTLIIPEKTALLPNYPNPFNPETWIPYHLAEPAHVVLTLYSVDGKAVRRLDLGHQAAGYYQSKSRAAYWDGRNAVGERVASGLYFYTLTAGDFSATRKMLIMK